MFKIENVKQPAHMYQPFMHIPTHGYSQQPKLWWIHNKHCKSTNKCYHMHHTSYGVGQQFQLTSHCYDRIKHCRIFLPKLHSANLQLKPA
jgi:hypothetical protein